MQKRLEILRETLNFQWGELAAHLEISRSMLDQVRTGKRKAGPRLMRRIMEAERACGIVPPEDHLLPLKKLKQLEYGVPGDAEILREGARVVRDQVDLIKAIRAGIRGEVRAAVDEKLGDIRELLRSLLAEEREKGR